MTHRYVQSSKELRKTDSILVRETLRDTVVRIEADSASLQALVACDSLGRVYLKELISYQAGMRVGPPTLHLRDNVLTATARVDSMEIYLQLKERYHTEISRQEQQTTQTVEVNHLTRWQTLWVTLGKILAALTGVLLLLRIKKPR